MRDVMIQGAGMTRFARQPDRSARDLAEEAVFAALADGDVQAAQVQAAFVGNAAAGLMTGQESVRGQVVLRRTGLMGVPIVNVENADASSASALHLGWLAVAGGMYDRALVLGIEKLGERGSQSRAFNATMDLQELAEIFGPGRRGDRVHAIDMQGQSRQFAPDLLALVAAKNRHHGSLNACAWLREEVTVEQVRASPTVSGSLTRLMCASVADGAAAVVLSAAGARGGRTPSVRIAASVLASGRGDDMRLPYSIGAAPREAYAICGAGPEDLDVIEVCDSTAHAELHVYSQIGLCPEGEESRLIGDRHVWLGGRQPVNTSGGMIARGNAMGAVGVAQVVELAWQLEGRCGPRQVASARLGLAHTVGGWVGSDVAACAVHVLQT